MIGMPKMHQRVKSHRIPGRFGKIIDHQARDKSGPERWQVKPEKPGELAVWLTKDAFSTA
jgi:hypothetical protein